MLLLKGECTPLVPSSSNSSSPGYGAELGQDEGIQSVSHTLCPAVEGGHFLFFLHSVLWKAALQLLRFCAQGHVTAWRIPELGLFT